MKNLKKLTTLCKSLFLIVFIIKFLESLTLFGHGDALSYHIVWPKIVLNFSLSDMLNEFFSFYLAGYFDAIYFIPQLIFGAGSMPAHIIGQNIHFLFSLGFGSYLMLKSFGKNYWGYLAALSILTIAKGTDFFLYAKNDGALAMFCLLAYLIVDEKIKIKNKTYRAILVGLLFGFIPGIKLTGFFALIPLGIYYLYKSRHNLKKFSISFVVALIVLAPIIILKQLKLDGAIFYPALLNTFPGKLDPIIINSLNNFVQTPLTSKTLGMNFQLFFLAKFFLIGLIPLAILQWKKEKEISPTLLISLSYFLLYLVFNGGISEPRFLFPCFFLNIYYFFEQISKINIKSKKILFLLPLLVLADSKLDKSIMRMKRLSWYAEDRPVYNHLEKTRIWKYIKNPTGKRSYILSDHFPQLYYADKGLILEHIYTTPRAVFFNDCLNPNDINFFSYFIFLRKYPNNPCYQKIIESSLFLGHVQGFDLYQRKNQ